MVIWRNRLSGVATGDNKDNYFISESDDYKAQIVTINTNDSNSHSEKMNTFAVNGANTYEKW